MQHTQQIFPQYFPIIFARRPSSFDDKTNLLKGATLAPLQPYRSSHDTAHRRYPMQIRRRRYSNIRNSDWPKWVRPLTRYVRNTNCTNSINGTSRRLARQPIQVPWSKYIVRPAL